MLSSPVYISNELMARIEQAAANESLSPEDWIVGAAEEKLRRKRREELFERAERRTRALGIPESQVDAIVREERDKAKFGLVKDHSRHEHLGLGS